MNKNPQIDKYSIFIPKDLDIDKDLNTYGDKNLKKHKDKFKYLIHLLYVTPLTNRRYYKQLTATVKSVSKRIPIPLSGKKLSYLFGERYYKKILDCSKELKYIESTGHWIIGEKPIGYRLTKQLRGQTYKRDFIENPILIKKILKIKSSDGLDEVGKKLYEKLKELDFDFDSAEKYLDECLKQGEYSPTDNKYISRKLMIDSWKHYGIRASIDEKGFRLHTNLTNLAEELRYFLSWNGKKLQGVDIRNSQPFFLIPKLIEFYNSNKTFPPTSYYDDNVPFDSKLLLEYITNTFQSPISNILPSYDLTVFDNLPNDVQHYIYQTITGKLYDYLNEIKTDGWGKNYTRKIIKKNVYTVFYKNEDDENSSIVRELFIQIFPNVFRYIEITKKKDYRKFSISLQKTESDMVLRTICKRILSEKPTIPLFTIHDSILSTSEHIPYIITVMNEEIYKKYSILPNLKIEKY
jgi:hypothetical protein